MPPAPPKTKNNPGSPPKLAHRILFALFLAQWLLVWMLLLSNHRMPGPAHWPEGLLVLLAAANTLAIFSRELPWQNVLAASALITIISGASEGLALLAGAPAARLVAAGSSWAVPLVWLVAILNARTVARLALFRWRKSPMYGLWLIALATLLVALFGIGLRSFCATYPLPRPTSISWLHSLFWAATAASTLVAASPWLIDKRPVERLPVRQPILIWMLVNFLFASAASLTSSWPVTVIIVIANAIILFVACA